MIINKKLGIIKRYLLWGGYSEALKAAKQVECEIDLLQQQNKRYRDAFKNIMQFPSNDARQHSRYADEVARKALEVEVDDQQ